MSRDTRVRVYDSTLREGEQAAGARLSAAQKRRLAAALAGLGVDVVEAGFPVLSGGEHDAVRAVAAELGTAGSPAVAALARARTGDVERACDALAAAHRPRITVFVPVSDRQLAAHRDSREASAERAHTATERARRLVGDVQFALGDAVRADPEHVRAVARIAADAGASTVTLVDTVGWATPDETATLVRGTAAALAGRDVVLGVHCHDDLGLALANAWSGLQAGARQVECTVNGVGDRAGNVALEQIVTLLHTRDTGLRTTVRGDLLVDTSRLVGDETGQGVPDGQPVVGRNALRHETGVHQDAVLRDPGSYEVVDRSFLGLPAPLPVLGKHTGVAGLRAALHAAGYPVTAGLLHAAFRRLKTLDTPASEPVDVHRLVRECTAAAPGDPATHGEDGT